VPQSPQMTSILISSKSSFRINRIPSDSRDGL
jgi:hypothetical protein